VVAGKATKGLSSSRTASGVNGRTRSELPPSSVLEDLLDVPVVLLDFAAEQFGIADPSCGTKYTGS
jgi:hypothetical protein